jgi:hypothetical protein
MKNLIIPLILLLFYSGTKRPNEMGTVNRVSNDKFFEIKYENILKNKKMIYLSQVASNVQYIRLETNPSCLLHNLRGIKFFFVDSLIFVQNLDHVLKFSIDGKFIKQIANPGRGPGEVSVIYSMSVIPAKRLLVLHQRESLLYFSFNGDLIKTVRIPYHQEVKVLNDSRYIAWDPSTNGSERYNFILASDRGDTISTVKNYTTWKKVYSGTLIISGGAFEAFYSNMNSYFFKSAYNDTVYFVNNSENKIEPSYSINFGKYKLPEELIPAKVASDPIKLQKYKEKAVNFYWGKPFEASNKVFIRSSCMGKHDVKYLLYDKDSAEGYLLVDESGESTGLINDWDGGFDFWPAVQKNYNQIIMPIDIQDFKKKIESNSSDKRIIKYPDRQKAFQSLISTSDVMDNPIIMVVTLKTKF